MSAQAAGRGGFSHLLRFQLPGLCAVRAARRPGCPGEKGTPTLNPPTVRRSGRPYVKHSSGQCQRNLCLFSFRDSGFQKGSQRCSGLKAALKKLLKMEQNSSELLNLVSSTKMMTWHLRLSEAICVVFFSPSYVSKSSVNLLMM